MERDIMGYLLRWIKQEDRQPLILRGARQVGKTWLVRHLASKAGRELVEINFERNPELAIHFSHNDPVKICQELSFALDKKITPEQSLLFLDEIQAAPDVLPTLRWFFEEMPALPVVAAGSLLEFLLADHNYSLPVGRVTYAYVEPLSFPEFLRAHQKNELLNYLSTWQLNEDFSDAVHEKATHWFQRYMMVGGMPAVVQRDCTQNSAEQCRQLQRDLISTYRDDFNKYAPKVNPQLLDTVLLAVTASLGKKFVYSHVGQNLKHYQVKQALERLSLSRLCHTVTCTTANGLPLGGSVKEQFKKILMLDIGLVHALIDTPATEIHPPWRSLSDTIRGQLLEQITGQQLRTISNDPNNPAALHYWQREGGRPGEIDFLIQANLTIIPIEIKAGAAGSMKSLHQFMYDKKLNLAVRLDSNPPSKQDINVKTPQSNAVNYTLLNLPHYLTWRLATLAAGW